MHDSPGTCVVPALERHDRCLPPDTKLEWLNQIKPAGELVLAGAVVARELPDAPQALKPLYQSEPQIHVNVLSNLFGAASRFCQFFSSGSRYYIWCLKIAIAQTFIYGERQFGASNAANRCTDESWLYLRFSRGR